MDNFSNVEKRNVHEALYRVLTALNLSSVIVFTDSEKGKSIQ